MTTSFFSSLFGIKKANLNPRIPNGIVEPLQINIPSNVTFHLNLPDNQELLKEFQLVRCYEVGEQDKDQALCEWMVNGKLCSFRRITSFSSWFVDKHHQVFQNYELLNLLFGKLPVEKQKYFIDSYYDPNQMNTRLASELNSTISIQAFRTMCELSSQYLEVRNIRIQPNDEDYFKLEYDGPAGNNYSISIHKKKYTIWFYYNNGSYNMYRHFFSLMESELQKSHPGISFARFADEHSTLFSLFMASHLLKELSATKEFKLKKTFDPSLHFAEAFIQKFPTYKT